jgi:hypothetical protein
LLRFCFRHLPAGRAQNSSASLPDAPSVQVQTNEKPVAILGSPRRILKDQEAIWASPAHIRESNALGPIALVLATAVLVATDHQVMSSSQLQKPPLHSNSATASNALEGAFIAAPAAIYAIGAFHHAAHATETGILDGEAILDSLAVSEVTKAISRRERPAVDNAKERFFQSNVGIDSSFPSNHAVVAWSSAAVIASEYNRTLTQIAAYGLAAGVGASRILARQHFPSDVLAGSAVGWMIGRYVVHRHYYIE